MNKEIFSKWLQPVNEDSSKAKCRVCNVVLGAKRSDLINHCESQRHLKNMKVVEGTKQITQVNFMLYLIIFIVSILTLKALLIKNFKLSVGLPMLSISFRFPCFPDLQTKAG